MIFSKSKLSLPVPAINPMNKALDNLGVKWPKPASEESVCLQVDSAVVKPRSELVSFCEKMNVKGLHKFISDNRKNLATIREEIPSALKKSPHPYGLVLDSLEEFYAGDNLVLDGKKDGDLLGVRRTCLMLMESLGQLQTDNITCFSSEGHMLTTDIKERAKKTAFEWKSKLDSLDIDAINGNCLEAHAFFNSWQPLVFLLNIMKMICANCSHMSVVVVRHLNFVDCLGCHRKCQVLLEFWWKLENLLMPLIWLMHLILLNSMNQCNCLKHI